jgi:spore coat protein CotH
MKSPETGVAKKLLFSFVLFLSLSCSIQASFFSDTVHTLHVYFDSPSFWTTLDRTHETDEYISCDVVFDLADTFYNVGIKLKGNSSYGHPGTKKPFHIKLNKYTDSLEYRGLDRYTFNNGFKDPTFLREKLASEEFQSLVCSLSR